MPIRKSIHLKIFPHGLEKLRKEIGKNNSVLDLGCGRNSPLQYCRHRYSLGVDLSEGYLRESKIKGIHSEYMMADITKVYFEPGSFDVVLCAQVIEHITEEEVNKLFDKMEKWARHKIIVTTPNGFLSKEAYDENEHQKHLSGWTIDELEEKGYIVRGISGMKIIRTRCKPSLFWRRIFDITSKFTYFFPRLAFQLLAVKEIY